MPTIGRKDLPVNKGRFNVDMIRYDYYRDATVALEAFKAGQLRHPPENSSKTWATGYDSPALRDGLIKKEVIPNQLPSAMQGFGFNLRRPLFQDPLVRQALGYAFDFEWSNKNLFYGAYTRTRSYFDNSELAATGVPQGDELKILEPFRGQIPDEVFTKEYDPPKYDDTFTIRDGLRDALALLKQAGWSFKGEQLVNDKTGQPFQFEILNDDPQIERVTLPLDPEPEAARHHRDAAHGRCLAIPAADEQFRLRHDRRRHPAIAVAGQRAARVLRLAPRPTSRAARTCSASRARSSTQLIEELIAAPTRAEPRRPCTARSIACCNGATT